MPPRYDVLGVDGYNRNSWRQVATVLGHLPTRVREGGFSRQVLYVIEHGCVEGAAGAKADWFTEAGATIAGWPTLLGVSYNHEGGTQGNDIGRSYRVDTSTSAIAGFRAMGSQGRFASS